MGSANMFLQELKIGEIQATEFTGERLKLLSILMLKFYMVVQGSSAGKTVATNMTFKGIHML